MLSDFDVLVRQRAALKSWWALGTTTARYDNRNYSLHVAVQKPTMVAYCGQAYAGAKNYHDAPDFFVEAICKEMQNQSPRIAREAYAKEIERLDALIEEHRTAVLSQLSAE